MSDANRTALRYVEESAFGAIPATPPFRDLRYTASSLAYTPNTVTSSEIRSDRQITDLVLVGFEASGNTNHEISFEAFDDLLEGAFFSDWSYKISHENLASDTPVSDIAATVITVDSGGASYVAGMITRHTGSGVSANNKLARVVSSTATTVTYPGATFTAEAVVPVGYRMKAVGFEGVAGDIDAATGPNRITSSTLALNTFGIQTGDWLKLGGTSATNKFTTAACNGWARVLSVAANAIIFDVAPVGFAASVETTTLIQVWFGDRIINGVTEKSYSLELEYAGMAVTEYEYYRGMEVNSFSLSAEAQAILTSEFSFMGKDALAPSTSRTAGATTLAAKTNDIMNTSSNVGSIREGGAEVSSPNYVMTASISIENNLRSQKAIGQPGAIGIGVGRASITGELQTYFGSSTLLAKLRNNTATSFDMRVNDPTGSKSYVIDMPRVKFQSGSPEVTGIDTDIMVNLGYQAVRDPTLGYTIAMHRFEYFEA